MTCPHCELENLDENASCFRCGQALDLSDVDVVPARLRRGPSRRSRRGHRLDVRSRLPDPHAPRLEAALCAFFSLVPGLGQAVMGRPSRAALQAAVWLGAVTLAWIADPPTQLDRQVVLDWLQHPRWLPITVHAWIVADAWQCRLRQRGERAGGAEVLAVTLVATLLLAAPNTLLQLTQARESLMSMRHVRVHPGLEDATVAPGDEVLVADVQGRPPALSAGDFVILARDARPALVVQRAGTVHAVAGDGVAWSQAERRLTVNGVPRDVPHHVSAALVPIPDAQLALASGELLVFPLPGEPMTSLRDAVVREERVEAVGLRITDPPQRRRILRMR